eukprot:GGOE01052376.1.p1 GENE.GGOE01052376.1~~GGOE01052376.1.p1  ORF type:complete len:292 (+),score=54.71 GGOE01052376.1:80-877(+)
MTNPLDVLRARLQASRSGSQLVGRKDFVQTLLLLHCGGLRGGYLCGLVPNLLTSVPANTIYLTTYAQLRLLSTRCGFSDVVGPSLAAFGAVGCTTTILNPLFVVRLRIQLKPGSGMLSVMNNIWRNDGLQGFYRGLSTGIAGRTCESALYWTLYEHLKQFQPLRSFSVPKFGATVLTCSVVAKLLSTIATYPYNVVRTHLWEVNAQTGLHDHNGLVTAARHILQADGFRGLYAGLTPHIMRTIPSTGITFVVFELLSKCYLQHTT